MITLYVLRLMFTFIWIFISLANSMFFIKYRKISDLMIILYSFVSAMTALLILID